jgi:hypothetical protein
MAPATPCIAQGPAEFLAAVQPFLRRILATSAT